MSTKKLISFIEQHSKRDLSVINYSKTAKIICFWFKIEFSCQFRKTAQFMAKSVFFWLFAFFMAYGQIWLTASDQKPYPSTGLYSIKSQYASERYKN
jgi:hypothetical protein